MFTADLKSVLQHASQSETLPCLSRLCINIVSKKQLLTGLMYFKNITVWIAANIIELLKDTPTKTFLKEEFPRKTLFVISIPAQ